MVINFKLNLCYLVNVGCPVYFHKYHAVYAMKITDYIVCYPSIIIFVLKIKENLLENFYIYSMKYVSNLLRSATAYLVLAQIFFIGYYIYLYVLKYFISVISSKFYNFCSISWWNNHGIVQDLWLLYQTDYITLVFIN